MLYTVGNSNAMNGYGANSVKKAGTPIVTILQIVIDIAFPLVIIAWGAVVFIQLRKQPEEK